MNIYRSILEKNWIIAFLCGILSLISAFIPMSVSNGSFINLGSSTSYFFIFGLIIISLDILGVMEIKNSFFLFEEIDIVPSFTFPTILAYIIPILAVLIIILGIKQKSDPKSPPLFFVTIIIGSLLLLFSILEFIFVKTILDLFTRELFGYFSLLIPLKYIPHVGFYFLLFSAITIIMMSVIILTINLKK